MDLVNIVLKHIKNRKVVWGIIIITILYFFAKYFPYLFKLILQNISSTILRITVDLIPFTIALLLINITFHLLRYSDRKYNEGIAEKRSVFKTYKSEQVKPFQVIVIEKSEYISGKERPIREITLINNSDMELNYVLGQVDFYEKKKRIFSFPFEIEWLKNGYGHLIMKKEYNIYKDRWEEFDFRIEKSKLEKKELSNKRYEGVTLVRLIPDIRVKNRLEVLVKYDLTWIKEQLKHLVSKLTCEFTKQRRLFILKVLLASIIMVLLLMGIYYVFSTFLFVLIEVGVIWFKSFKDIIYYYLLN